MFNLLMPILGGILGATASAENTKAQSEAIVKQIEAEGNNYVFETSIIEQQRVEARRELSDLMTDTGLQALEAEATVRARNAMKGISGSSVKQSSLEIAMKANLANADLIRKYENTDITLLRRQLAKRADFENKTASLASGIASPASGFLSTLSGGLQGVNFGSKAKSVFDEIKANNAKED